MKINKQLFDTLLSQAADSVRLRQNYDLRKIEEILYNDKGVEYERYYLDANSDCRGCVVPKGVWHTIVVREPSVIFEAKDGVFKPLTSDDVWNYE